MTVASNVRQTLAALKGIEAQLSSLALNSKETEAQRVFHDSMVQISEIKNDVQMRLYELEREEEQYQES